LRGVRGLDLNATWNQKSQDSEESGMPGAFVALPAHERAVANKHKGILNNCLYPKIRNYPAWDEKRSIAPVL